MFDALKVKNELVQWIRDWFAVNGPGCKGVVAISGGKDSSIVAALLTEALGKENVIGVLLPRNVQPDIDMSYGICEFLGIKYYEVNIGPAADAVEEGLRKALGEDGVTKQSVVNLPPRIRMSVTYAVSQCVNGRVANTCNLSEDYVGYATRYGDGAGDFGPISRLTVQEETDEDNLGFTYAVLDRYIREGVIDDPETKKRIDRLHEINAFKLRYMDCFEYVPE